MQLLDYKKSTGQDSNGHRELGSGGGKQRSTLQKAALSPAEEFSWLRVSFAICERIFKVCP